MAKVDEWIATAEVKQFGSVLLNRGLYKVVDASRRQSRGALGHLNEPPKQRLILANFSCERN